RVVPNEWFTTIVDTSDEWIRQRSGIVERRFAADDEFTSDMAAAAARAALENAGFEPKDVDYILIATASPDNQFPSTASRVGNMLAMRGAAALDMSTACAGFVYGMELATALVNAGKYRRVLLIGAEKLSAITNFSDRTTCVLLADGAGAAVIGDGGSHVMDTRCYAHFDFDALNQAAGGCRMPVTPEAIEQGLNKVRMNGREVYRFVVSSCVEIMKYAMAK